MRTLISVACVSTLFSVAVSGQGTPAPKSDAPKPAAAQPVAPPKPARPNGLYGTMVTTMGTMTFELFEKEAPLSVRNFCDLVRGTKAWRDPATGQMVRRPLMPGTQFHRVIPGFMIQGGDPTATGAGEVGFSVPDEFNSPLTFDRPGRFGMANTGRPNSNSSQFFITEVPTPHLNGHHTIFGQVIDGVDLIGKIARVPRDQSDKPRTPVKIVSIKFERVGPAPPNPPEGGPAPAQKKAAAPVKKATTPATTTKAPAPTKQAAPPVKKQ
jgi:cyclophilin family peptidyl-prolyl cis-trans isomerase